MTTLLQSPQMYWLKTTLGMNSAKEATPTDIYNMLEGYYYSNGLYDAIQQYAYENAVWTPAMKALRNPAHRAVEFFVATLWPGALPKALPIVAENDRIIPAIEQVWQWSNWGAKKQLAARYLAMLGDCFIKAATRQDASGAVTRTYLQVIKPQLVTDVDTDERGYITAIRLDIPQIRREGRVEKPYWKTEVWSKSLGAVYVYEHNQGAESAVEHLGTPIRVIEFADMGIDFVPFVQAKFQDVGNDRGMNCFWHALDKIDEANRQATRLSQMIFRYNRPLWALQANGVDGYGRPLPPPSIGTEDNGGNQVTTIGDDELLPLPGNSTIAPLVPNINYASALEVLEAQLREIELDLPELAYYHLKERGDQMSGRAIRLLMSPAIDRLLEVRGNAEDALVRAQQMALTMGVNYGLFSDIGNYENGDFEHSIGERDVFHLEGIELAEEATAWMEAEVPQVTALKRVGWSTEEVDEMLKEKKKADGEKEKSLGQALLDAQRRFDVGRITPLPDDDGDEGMVE